MLKAGSGKEIHRLDCFIVRDEQEMEGVGGKV